MPTDHQIVEIHYAFQDRQGNLYPNGVQGPPESARCSCGWIVQMPDDVRSEAVKHAGPQAGEVIDTP